MHILQDILYKVHLLEVVGATDIAVSSIAIDSRKVIKGTAFVAIKGVAQDGHEYISKAIELGAKVIVCKIKDNQMAFTSVAYPVVELRLPQWFKDECERKYEEFIPWFEENWELCVSEKDRGKVSKERWSSNSYGVKRLRGMISFMKSEDWSQRLPEMKDYLEKIDTHRGITFYDTFPEMKDIFRS